MTEPDYMQLRDSDEIIARTVCVTESIKVSLNFNDQIVGIENTAGLVDFGVLRFVLMHTPWVPMPPTELVLTDGFEYCTTDSQKRRHISKNMKPVPLGRAGQTLCGHYGVDQSLADVHSKGTKPVPKPIAELPVCAGCRRTAERLIG